MYNVDTLIKVAEDELFYLEKATNDKLDNKTDNAGSNNFTKYGRDMGCNGLAWCDAFVDWCFVKAFGKFAAQGLLIGFSNYTPTSASYFKKRGLWTTQKPQKGDIIFFKNATRICHTGIVVEVDSTYVHTIEGNTSSGTSVVPNGGGVYRKKYKLIHPKIAGYGRPNYESTDRPVLYKGCVGVAVGKLQKKLNERLSNNKLVVDCDYGNITMTRIIEFQALKDLPKTGICDAATWGKLYG